jgi:hypothetical protein
MGPSSAKVMVPHVCPAERLYFPHVYTDIGSSRMPVVEYWHSAAY